MTGTACPACVAVAAGCVEARSSPVEVPAYGCFVPACGGDRAASKGPWRERAAVPAVVDRA